MGRFAHLTHPKSGSHWVTDVLSEPKVIAFAPAGTRFERTADFRLGYWAKQEDHYFTGPMFSVTFEEWSHERDNGDKALYVARDPRDQIVSWTFSFAYSHETWPHIRLIRPILLETSLRHRLMIGAYQYWQSAWIVQSWAGKPSTDSEYITTYERILANEFAEFRKILDFFAWPVPDDVLREAIAYHSFERRTRGRDRGTVDPFSHYRKGSPGDWKNYFDRTLGEMFESACPGLLVELGYETTKHWYEALPDTLAILDDGDDLEAASPALLAELHALREERKEVAAKLQSRAEALNRLAEQFDSIKLR